MEAVWTPEASKRGERVRARREARVWILVEQRPQQAIEAVGHGEPRHEQRGALEQVRLLTNVETATQKLGAPALRPVATPTGTAKGLLAL